VRQGADQIYLGWRLLGSDPAKSAFNLYRVIGGETQRVNSFAGITGTPVLEAYKLDGTFLWRIDLVINIREGEHYTQFIVYDLDGDGRAEIACKTVDYIPGRDPIGGWGGIGGNGGTDSCGNRSDRFLACVAYLDGRRPSLVMCRGVYGRTVLAAWDWRGGELNSRWVFDPASASLPSRMPRPTPAWVATRFPLRMWMARTRLSIRR
jgi:hypothetical protein